MSSGSYLSIKWKIAILIGGVFLFLHSLFSYFLYLDANEKFLQGREIIQVRNTNVARALIDDSFSVLAQFAELSSIVESSQADHDQAIQKIISSLDVNWQHWQFIWGIESTVFYDHQGQLVKNWGEWIEPNPMSVDSVLNGETPDFQIVCPDTCFQFVFIPVMSNSKVIGTLGVSRSFADTVIEFNNATASDFGILIPAETTAVFHWPFKISAMTHLLLNRSILEFISQNYGFEDFFEARKIVAFADQSIELSIFSLDSNLEKTGPPPYFFIINNVTDELIAVEDNLRNIWLMGVVSLLLSLFVMLVLLFFSLRRVGRLLQALPLLAEHKYNDFKKLVPHQAKHFLGTDEIDLLGNTANILSDQLEELEQEVNDNIYKLVEQGYELTNERDFIKQLVDVAPIIVLTQDCNGVILSINQVGVQEFSMDENRIIGGVFDSFIPENEEKHLARLKQLRSGASSQFFKVDGMLNIKSLKKLHISWIHAPVKPVDINKSTVILTLGMDITERMQIEKQMMRMATLDHLTGMNNRHCFQIEFAKEIAYAKRYGSSLALFYVDLDQFKIINDNSGHDAGDQLLKMVAKTLSQTVRQTDIVSRIGGDEFTLLMPRANQQGIKALAIKINEQLKALELRLENNIYKTSASIGVAIFPQHGTDEHELLSNADLAMYQAKESGPGQYHIFSPDKGYKSRLSHRGHWKNILEDALENDRFILLYQPIMDMATGGVSHYECLTRIAREDGGYLMPGDFIPVAEELGFIGQIDRLIVRKAVDQHVHLKQQGKQIKLAINLSGRSFNDNTIFDDISVFMHLPGVDSSQIIFEITETSAVSNFASAQSLINKIRNLGCSLALDDFGVGFSSFYYLKHLPVDYVKIDGSFIKQLDTNSEDKVFVKALTDVSQSLGKKTIAEFVENEKVLEILREFGIDYAQGYHIGKPKLMEEYHL